MKTYIFILSLFGMFAFGSIAVSAQCDPSTSSHIKCGYYNEGYTDGIADARSYQSNDYRRYRAKFENKYESFYRDGYEAGYTSIAPQAARWTSSQRSAYDAGYNLGQDDRRRSNEARASQANSGGYDQSIGLYFQQGYNDGFSNRGRRYDFPIGQNPDLPPGGGTSATAYWTGRVDDRGNIIIRGNTIYAENASGTGSGVQTYNQSINGALPRRETLVSARKTDGRGSVSVIQQPNRSNNYTAIVQVFDPNGGAGDYRVEIAWTAPANVEEPYRPGSISWRGRVDQTARIMISGADVQTQDASGTGLVNVNFNLNGSLARRPGTVNVRKRSGRGTVYVTQQPTWENDFTAIVEISDPKSGSDQYEIEITW